MEGTRAEEKIVIDGVMMRKSEKNTPPRGSNPISARERETLAIRKNARKEKEEMRRSEKRMKEFAIRRLLMTPLLSSPNRKRVRGEDGEWTGTPEKPTESRVSEKMQEIIPTAVYRPVETDLTGAEKIPENGKFSDPGSPKM